jgi:peptidoglycan DL-endopeptidase CwlO
MEVLMRLRPTGSAAAILTAVTLAMTAASPRPAQAFFFLPMLFQNQPMQQQPQQGRAPSDNKWRDEGARPIKPSTTTRSRDDDDDKPSSSSAGKKAKTSTKSEAKSNSGQTSRGWSAKQEPPASKSSSRASTASRTGSGNSGGAKTPAQDPSPGGTAASTQPASPGGASTNTQQASSTGPGSNLGDTLDEKLGDVFKARIDELLKQPPK